MVPRCGPREIFDIPSERLLDGHCDPLLLPFFFIVPSAPIGKVHVSDRVRNAFPL